MFEFIKTILVPFDDKQRSPSIDRSVDAKSYCFV